MRAVLALLAAMANVLTGGCVYHNPYESVKLSDEQKIELIDSMRANGSYEQAREKLNQTVAQMADRISAAVPGQSWHFDDDPYALRVKRGGLPCENGLTGDIAGRPLSDIILFAHTFTAEQWPQVSQILHQIAADDYGIDDESSLFSDPEKRDYRIEGNGYEFRIGQATVATLNATGDCFLFQKVLDMPPGQLPPEPPILPSDRGYPSRPPR
ncbi:hypothetical protein MKOR_32430 [Mycolicibacillus koreensis]|nr:LppA family lipoprotein [Mycolicibacillus koreensis]BBY55992.1 hypothetical protein MKOR_32430 [Mycolicibacillus koreensis]